MVLQQVGNHGSRSRWILGAIITANTWESDALSRLHWTIRYREGKEPIQADMMIQYFGTRK